MGGSDENSVFSAGARAMCSTTDACGAYTAGAETVHSSTGTCGACIVLARGTPQLAYVSPTLLQRRSLLVQAQRVFLLAKALVLERCTPRQALVGAVGAALHLTNHRNLISLLHLWKQDLEPE